DFGGGTSDFSLIAVREQQGNLELHRVAVGDHILLGGDNMDLTLAHVVAQKLAAAGTTLDAFQMRGLALACRSAKETLLADSGVDSVPLVVASRGSKMIGGSLRTELTRAEVSATLLEGFFPAVASSARPAQRPRGGLTHVGLPFAQDPAVTRHLASFLARQAGALAQLEAATGAAPAEPGTANAAVGAGIPSADTKAATPGTSASVHGASDGAHAQAAVPPHASIAQASFLHPTAVLFNGGIFKSSILARRTMETLNAWLAAEQAPPARLLAGADLDLAVAHGAAYYGRVRRGQGVRIRGGTALSCYVAIESAMPAIPGMEAPIQALCVAPFGMEEGSEAALHSQQFGLVVGEPVHFRFFGSSVRRQDEIGTLLDVWAPDELSELDEIVVTLPAEDRNPGDVVLVELVARITEAGTLELLAAPTDGAGRWKIEFNVRSTAAD
ncbi:MAG: hypothetical protein ACRYGK_15625, partial [Janthinobacterium lividum]